jgi:hypothetical protein
MVKYIVNVLLKYPRVVLTIYISCNDATAPSGAGPPHYRGFTITLI